MRGLDALVQCGSLGQLRHNVAQSNRLRTAYSVDDQPQATTSRWL
jgi:hypothetical protein